MRVADRIAASHKLAAEQLRIADVRLACQQGLIACMRMIEQGADGTLAIFFRDRRCDPDKVLVALDENGGACTGGCRELVGDHKIEIEHRATTGQQWRTFRVDHDLMLIVTCKSIREMAGKRSCEPVDLVAKRQQSVHGDASPLIVRLLSGAALVSDAIRYWCRPAAIVL